MINDVEDKRTTSNASEPYITPDNVVRRDDVMKREDESEPFSPGGNSSTTTAKRQTTPISTEIPAVYKANSYAELIPQLERRMAEFKPLSEEELKKLRRRQKAEGIISGISDAVQSVANLIFTHRYAPNMYNPQEGLSARAKERFEKEKAQREADSDKFLNYALNIGKMKDAENQRGLEMWKTEQDLARQDRKYDEEAERKNAIAEAQRGKMKAAADKDESMTAYYDTKADLLLKGFPLKVAESEAKVAKLKADANKANRQGTASSGGRGRYYGTFNGVAYTSKADYEKAVSESAERNSVPQTETRTYTSGDRFYKKTSKKTVNRKTSDVARDAERAERKGHSTKPQLPQKQNSGNKKGWASGLKL